MEHIESHQMHIENRIGFHYFDDTVHFSDADLKRWVIILKKLDAHWLHIRSSTSRAIPENFIKGFRSEGIQLLVDFHLDAGNPITLSELKPLIEVYGKWGIGYASIFKHGNLKKSWTIKDWADPSIISKHADRFIEFASLFIDCGIRPVYGPLFPGGQYPDLAFFENLSKQLSEKVSHSLINELIIGVYGWDFNKSLNWGVGGQNKWPKSSLLYVTEDQQNHQGFRAFDWYSEIIKKFFLRQLPVILFEVGYPGYQNQPMIEQSPNDFNKMDAIFQLLRKENVFDPEHPEILLEYIPDHVLTGFFHLISSQGQQNAAYRWFSETGDPLLPAQAFFIRNPSMAKANKEKPKSDNQEIYKKPDFLFNRFVLIDENLKPDAPQILEDLNPYLEKYQPNIGYSIKDAIKSAVILFVSPININYESTIEALRRNGSLVKHISPEKIPKFLQEDNHVSS